MKYYLDLLPPLNSITGFIFYPLVCYIIYQLFIWLVRPYFEDKPEDIRRELIKRQGIKMRQENLR
jgi:hypothetical protein